MTETKHVACKKINMAKIFSVEKSLIKIGYWNLKWKFSTLFEQRFNFYIVFIPEYLFNFLDV